MTKKLALLAAVAGAAAIFPTAALAAFNGVVVGKSRGSVAAATASGVVHTVRTHASPRIGSRVRVSGTSVHVIGRAHRVRIHAVIVRRAGSTTFLAGGRSLLAVRTGRTLASALGNSSPSTGAIVNTTASVGSNGQLTATATQVVGQMPSIQVQAVVTAVGTGTITLSVNGQPLVLALPAGIQLPTSLVNQTVTLTLNLTGQQPVADDDDQGDDNNAQGDDNDDNGQGGDNHGGDDGGGGDG